jgi:hypothetical protein
MWQFPLNPIAPCSWTLEESQVESCEHQDNANIHCQPFPKSVSEEHEIYTDYDGCHRHPVKHASYLSAHFSSVSPRTNQPRDWLNAFPSLRGPFAVRDARATSGSPSHRFHGRFVIDESSTRAGFRAKPMNKSF